MSDYSRQNPSPRYRELVSLYQQMHREGIPGTAANDLYVGKSLIAHLPAIRSLVVASSARNLLDYGSGKGRLYQQRNVTLSNRDVMPSVREYLGVAEITCYDPAVPDYSVFPNRKFDGVISTDALEHCPEDDIPWIVEEMFAAANKFVYANVASYPAQKRLPNGENAHATQRSADWWADILRDCAARHSGVIFRFEILEEAKRGLFRRLFSPRRPVTTLSNAV